MLNHRNTYVAHCQCLLFFAGEDGDGVAVAGLPRGEGQRAHVHERAEHVDGGADGLQLAFLVADLLAVLVPFYARALAVDLAAGVAEPHAVELALVLLVGALGVYHGAQVGAHDFAAEGIAHAVDAVGPRRRGRRQHQLIAVGRVFEREGGCAGLFLDDTPFVHYLVVESLVGEIPRRSRLRCQGKAQHDGEYE